MRKLLVCCLLAVASAAAQAKEKNQVYQFDKPLYGAAYYSEYTPTDRLDEDIRMMKEAGLSVVRVGESTWSLFEPHDGQFEFAWMDRILDAMHKAGIKVILGRVYREFCARVSTARESDCTIFSTIRPSPRP